MNFGVSNSYAECTPRGAYAPRSWSGMQALREVCAFHLQIRPEHRCVRERAQHTCVFHLQTRYVHHGGLRPPLMMHGPVAFRLLLTLFVAYLFESDSCLRAGSGCCLRCSEVNQA
jgi:hypothetical protein